jgi:glycosyltransferase involved in cell wall biosynthesis
VGALGTAPSSRLRRSAVTVYEPVEDLPSVRKPRLRTGVVIPCYKVRAQILGVLEQIGPTVERIYVVDDACPEKTGALVQDSCHDPRVHVIFNPKNAGVGGAVIEGYKAALRDGMDVIVKLDGDGQMDPMLVPDLVGPIADGEADYTKGNRFYSLDRISEMPRLRILGNALLSLMTKLSAGYWNIFDPTNGYTAIHAKVARQLPLEKISRRYFFETDMLFRLNTIRAVVLDVPIDARYGSEASSLRISRIVFEFALKHVRNFFKRVFYNYYLRDMSIASIQLPLGVGMLLAGVGYGFTTWRAGLEQSSPSNAGTVTLIALLVILGTQFILAFLGYDIASVPTKAINPQLPPRAATAER